MRRNRQRRGPRHGFTMVEALGAVLLSMILLAIALAGYRLYEREAPVRSSAKRLNHAFVAARAYAISNNSNYTVRIDQRYDNYWIDETDDQGAVVVPKVTAPDPFDARIELRAVIFGANPTSASQALIPIRFYADGSSDDVRVILAMRGDAGKACTVRLYGPTGASRVLDGAWTTTATTPTTISLSMARPVIPLRKTIPTR